MAARKTATKSSTYEPETLYDFRLLRPAQDGPVKFIPARAYQAKGKVLERIAGSIDLESVRPASDAATA